MGIDGFGTFLKKKSPYLFKPVTTSYFFSKRMGFDMHNLTFRIFHRCKGNNFEAEVKRFARQIVSFKAAEYHFIFDGCTRGTKPVAHKKRKLTLDRQVEKRETLEKEVEKVRQECEERKVSPERLRVGTEGLIIRRHHTKAEQDVHIMELKKKHDTLIDLLEKANDSAKRPTKECFGIVKKVLEEQFGPETIVLAPDEGEREAALMCKDGKLDLVVSEDFDTLAFGCPNLIVKFMTANMAVLNLDDVLKSLDLTLEEFIDFAILSGCDYTCKVPGIAIKRAYDTVIKFRTIEAAYPTLCRRFKTDAESKAFRFQFARDKFLHRKVEPIVEEETKCDE